MRLLLTAGYDRALHAVALAELVRRDGHELAAILVVSPFNLARARALVRQRGRRFLLQAARRLAGRLGGAATDPVERLLDQHRIEHRSLRAWTREHRVPLRSVPSLNSQKAIAAACRARADGVLYGGGGILGQRFLDAVGGRVLNAHSGPLPAFRGMNACEWSILLGHPPAVTIH
ncbi:MAG TPA: formyltransferase family protein, partial [Planctomycetota bacterium]|nr:formyltransferase family protein [Planctomycetota bacterium]